MKQKGFTLVELLAVIAILALLIIIAMPNIIELFREARINTNLIVVENYANAGEQYYVQKFGEDDSFNGATNISSKLDISGKKADKETVFVNKAGEVAVFLEIDGNCYYKTIGAEKAQYTENIEYCSASMFMAGTPVIPVTEGDGIYYDEESNKLIYRSDNGLVSAKLNKTYCEMGLTKVNGTSNCDSYYLNTNFRYSEIEKNSDNVNNWIYFNCTDEKDPSTCEKWRIISYEYTNTEDYLGNLTMISPDLKGVHFDSENLHVASNELTNNFEKFYYSEYVTDSAKQLIKKSTYYNGNLKTSDELFQIKFPNDIYQNYRKWEIDSIYESSYEREWGYLNVNQWFEASTKDICYDGMEHYLDYSGYAMEDIPFSECNNWLNDGSFFRIGRTSQFVGELGTIASNFPGDNGERPVVTLTSKAQIVSGDGTKSNPYMLRYSTVTHTLTFREQFVENVKKLITAAEESSLTTLYSEKEQCKLSDFDDLQYVIQKENGKVVSLIAKDNNTKLFKIEIGSNFDNISIDDITEYSSEYNFNQDILLGLDSVDAWDKKCSGKNTLNCKIVQSANRNLMKTNDLTDENNDGLGGRIYYYSGNPSNIWVKFAGYCWKIVRTNENGSTKLLFSGNYSTSGCTSMTTGITGTTSVYNDDKMYAQHAGYMYNPAYSNSYAVCHTNKTSSTIKNKIDSWYANTILPMGSNVTSKIANTIYCNDRSVSDTATSGFGMVSTTYGSSSGYKCKNINDQFTLSQANGGTTGYGNNNLTYPVALITKAEASYSGLGSYAKSNRYLGNSVLNYWTMSPYGYRAGSTYYGASSWIVAHNYSTEAVSISDYYVTVNKAYILPAISLKAEVTVSGGSGSATSPYIIN